MIAYRGQSGSAALEFAFMAPLLLYLFFGGLEYGWYMTTQIVLTNAVADGARAGVIASESEDEDPALIAREAVRSGFWPFELDDGDITVEEVDSSASNGVPRRLEVAVASVDFPVLTGYLPADWVPRTLSARSVMVFP